MSKRIKTGLAMAAVVVVSVVGGGLALALPAQANPLVQTAITAIQDGTSDGETADDAGIEDGTNDGETADDTTQVSDGEAADGAGIEDGTNDGETADDSTK